MACLACGRALETHEYQSRAADEAHTSVTTCARCPIDAVKLNPIRVPKAPYRGLRIPIKRNLHIRVSSAGSRIGSVNAIAIDVPQNHAYHTMNLQHDHVVVQHSVLSTTLGGKSFEKNGILTISGPFHNISTSEIQRFSIGAGIQLIEYGTYTPIVRLDSEPRVTMGVYHQIASISDRDTYVYRQCGSRNKKVLVILRDKDNRSTWASIINAAMMQTLFPESMAKYVGNSVVTRLSNLSARAWDATTAPETGHIFTCKPDGERMWLILSGSIWYMISPRLKGGIKQWYTLSSGTITRDIVVIDVEYLGRHGFVLIDVLTSHNGDPAPVTRDMDWVMDEFHTIETKFNPPLIKVREYFRTYTEAFKYSLCVPYATDGVVAIRDGSTEILKIKTIKSMELRHIGDGTLVTADDDVIATSVHATKYEINSIIEARFTVDKSTRSINVTDMFARTDKASANSTAAVLNIINSGLQLRTKDDNYRRAALLWCNDLRKLIHAHAMERRDNCNIILDVGSGDGQSLDSMMASQLISCIYVEPDESKCNRLARRLGTKRVFTDPEDLVPIIRSLKTRLVNNAVLNCTLRDITTCDNLMSRLLPELKCIVCTFSMHFVAEDLQDISTLYPVPVYGCGYLYNGIGSDGVLINTSGVLMKRTSSIEAIVKWGTDKEYHEPMTTTHHYSGLGKVVKANQMLRPPNVEVNPGAAAICEHIYVLMP